MFMLQTIGTDMKKEINSFSVLYFNYAFRVNLIYVDKIF